MTDVKQLTGVVFMQCSLFASLAFGFLAEEASKMNAPRNPLTLVLALPDALYREGLRQLLAAQPGFAIVGVVADDREIVAECRTLQPDVLLLSPGEGTWADPVGTLTRLCEELGEQRVLLLENPARISAEKAITAGAWGHVDHGVAPDVLVQAVRAVAAGEVWASRGALSRALRQSLSPSARRALSTRSRAKPRALSAREVDVLRLVARGLDNTAIAEKLFVELSTVKTHLVRTFRKLAVSDRSAAVFAAISGGVDLSDAAPDGGSGLA